MCKFFLRDERVRVRRAARLRQPVFDLLRVLTCAAAIALGAISTPAVAASRTICGVTVNEFSYTGTFPVWFDETAQLYGQGFNSNTFLGQVSSNEFSSTSILNDFGSYGSQFGTNSIFNSFGTWGSQFQTSGVCNTFGSSLSVPQIVRNGIVVGYVTKNTFISGAVDPVTLIAALLRKAYLIPVSVAPIAPSLVAPANNAVVDTSATLSWNAVAGAGAYSVWVTNQSTNFITKLPLQAGTSAGIINIAPGITYKWSVASCFNASVDNATNCPNVSPDRTFSGKIGPVAPIAPSLVAPANNAVVDTSATLSWNAVPGAGAYRIFVTNGASGFISQFLQTGTSLIFADISPTVTYAWSVASCFDSSANSAANCPNFSPSWTFIGKASNPPRRRSGVDIDGDGKEEIVLSTATQMQYGKLVGNSIQFSGLTSSPGAGYRLVGAGDFDGNRKSDLAFQNMSQGTFGDVRVWPNFSANGEIFWRQVKQVWDVQAVGDLDGDGFDDLVWRYVVTDSPDTGVSYIWFSNGSSVTQVRKRGGAPLDWKLLGARDLNGDGAADMVYLSPQNQLRVLMATPNRTCANLTGGVVPSGFSPIKFADFTGSGRGDVLIRNAAGAVQLLSMNAFGLTLPPFTGAPDDQNASCTGSSLVVSTTTLTLPTTDPSWQLYASGDLNGDGISDIVWRQLNGAMTVWLMNANGALPTVIQNAGNAPAGWTVFQNGGPTASTSTPASQQTSPEGVYVGTASSGYTFNAAVLENNQFWTLYGYPDSLGGLRVYGIAQGDGTASSGSYVSSNARDYYYTGSVTPGALSATYVPGVSFNGSVVSATGSVAFSATVPGPSSYSYDAAASLSTISGNWAGTFLDSSPGSIAIQSSGAFTGSVLGCFFSGTILPRASGKNIFNVTLTFAGSPCALPGASAFGIGLTYLLPNGRRQLLLGGVDNPRSAGSVFFSVR